MKRLAARAGEVMAAGAQQDRLAAEAVAHRHHAARHARERALAAVLDEPLGAAHGRRAVLAGDAERARPVAPQPTGLRLVPGRGWAPLLRRPAGRELLAQLEVGDAALLGDAEQPREELRPLRRAARRRHRRELEHALDRVDLGAQRDALRAVDLDE